jgi:hypothetical protein
MLHLAGNGGGRDFFGKIAVERSASFAFIQMSLHF